MLNLFLILLKFLSIQPVVEGDDDGSDHQNYTSTSRFFQGVKPSLFDSDLFIFTHHGHDGSNHHLEEKPEIGDNYFDLSRLGGLFSHLLRTVHIEVSILFIFIIIYY